MDQAGYRRGLELLNDREFFEAHEVLEDVWRAAPAGEKRFLQGLIQLAVALHHYSRGNRAGAQSVLRRAGRNLSHYGKAFAGINPATISETAFRWSEALDRGESLPDFAGIDFQES